MFVQKSIHTVLYNPKARMIILLVLLIGINAVTTNSVVAQSQLLQGVEDTAGAAGLGAGASGNLSLIVGEVVKGLIGFLGVLFMVLIIWGGARWMTAGGNEESVTQAKRIIRNASIGLAIVVISYALSLWIFDVIIKATDAGVNDPVE